MTWEPKVPPEERRSVIVHADSAPGNVMVTDSGVAVLDFAMASRGTSLQDLTRLALQYRPERGKPQFRPAAVRGVVGHSLQDSPQMLLHNALCSGLSLHCATV